MKAAPTAWLCNAIANTKSGQLCDQPADYAIEYGFAGTITLYRCRRHALNLQFSQMRKTRQLRNDVPPLLAQIEPAPIP